jgi:excisionase family DNA binding protein
MDSRSSDPQLPKLLSVRDLATYLDVPVSTVYHWRHKQQGPPAVRYGKRLAFRADDVARWLEEQAAR